MRALIAAVLFSTCAVPAWAQSDEEVTAATKEEVRVYVTCLFNSAVKQANSSDLPAEKIADQTTADCIPERKALSARLRKPPINYPLTKAEDAIDATIFDVRPQLIDTVKKERTP